MLSEPNYFPDIFPHLDNIAVLLIVFIILNCTLLNNSIIAI